MSVISNATLAINNGFARFERASDKLVRSISGADDSEPAAAVVEQVEAKHQVQAGAAMVRLADEMYKALLEIGEHR